MSRVPIALAALMLAGCAGSYDRSAVPAAAAAMRRAVASCEKEQTASKFTACKVAAQHDFAMAIHLPNMDAFDAYAAQMMALAADRDAGRVSLKQAATRATSIRDEYWFACNCGLRGHRTQDYGDIIASVIPGPP